MHTKVLQNLLKSRLKSYRNLFEIKIKESLFVEHIQNALKYQKKL